MMEYYILIIVLAFAATTTIYAILYRWIFSEISEPYSLKRINEAHADQEIAKLRQALSMEKLEPRRLLEELKEIRRRAEEILDEERGNSESERGGDKGST